MNLKDIKLLKKAEPPAEPPPPPPPPPQLSEAIAAMEKNVLEKNLSEARFQHCLNVKKECKRLAELYHVNTDIAEIAGLLHDICKEMKPEEQEELMKLSDLDVCAEELATPQLWHGIAGAQLLKQKYCITNQYVLYAVRFHTVARKDMSQLEKIVYLADLTEEGRTFVDVHILRDLVNRNLDMGMYYALRFSVQDILRKGGLLPRHTVEAYNQYVAMFK